MKSSTAHLQTPAVRKKRIAAIRAAWKKKRAGKAAAIEKAPVIVYEGEKPNKRRKADAERLALAEDFVAVVATILGVR